MTLLDLLAERKIAEAQARGEFDALPGSGRPLDLQDDLLVPEDLRVAYRLLKNAGFVPPELEVNAQIRSAEALLQCTELDATERVQAMRRLDLLRARLGHRCGALADARYRDKLLVALTPGDDQPA